MNKIQLTAAALCGILLCQPVIAAGGIAAPNWQTVANAEFRLLWKTLTWAELAVDPEQKNPQDILDAGYAKALQIRYGVGVTADRLKSLAWKSVEDGWEPSQIERHRSKLESFFTHFVDVEKGDVYLLRWQPEAGLELLLNQTLLVQETNADAATMILSIWLGPAAVSDKQRQALLDQWRTALETFGNEAKEKV